VTDIDTRGPESLVAERRISAPLSRRLAVLDDRDREIVLAAGYGARMGLGSRPALLVVDVTYGFCGRDRMPIRESVVEQRRSCGEDAWDAVAQMRRLIDTARGNEIPVVYSAMAGPGDGHFEAGLWGLKNARSSEGSPEVVDGRGENVIVAELAPAEGELVYAKNKPSLFAGTGLESYLVREGVDSVVICGGTTSGCVYATAVDAFSMNLKVAVIEDACFDRVRLPHDVILLDIDLKYGDVMTTEEWIAAQGRAEAGTR
jgi:nicotinamidase-related amidase